ncbi:MAG: bifunctional (p)ppGpp synthetase/guanosine-3',5'-bis(diphosphate) 3'-pyrophosphohydrolase [Clostridia bacterium]|nr:bifunctional (p)ppGpp synthetase/guanosine-3',5'-bis(diphosphate) 3'-pyrophosphohydrolase [Clostridia bacterium]
MNHTAKIISEILEKEKIKYDKEKLNEVANYCETMYVNTKKANTDMIDHVIGVATEVARLRLDDTSIYASLLHGTLKCDNYNRDEIEEKFGKEIVEIIETVDKLSYLNYRTKEKPDSENLRNMFMAIAKDIRTVIIKLADRLYNMRNISNVDNEEVKLTMAQECLQIYAPIAHRLGMSKVKSELEDISFRILMPAEYNMIKEQIDEKKQEREEYIQARIDEVLIALKEQGIKAEVFGRPKHFFSIYKKMKEKKCRADDLFDLLAIRIIVSSIKDCYSVLGIVHDMYKPMPGRFKDYIAVPKTNMYQSLHTTVFGEGGRPFEIQIRTWDMHNVAERGIAAHFSYKEKSKKISEADKKIIWLRQTLEIQKELADNTENLNQMKVELFGEEVFVFTPMGDIKALPKGSTPIDFAYSIHQKVAEKMIGAKINSKMVPLNTKLENTDVVEIVTSGNSKGPNRDWLKYVKTASAKNKITAFLKKEGREVNIIKGKEIFEKQLRKQKIPKDILTKDEYLKIMLKKCNFNTMDECYENIGFGSMSPLKVINRLVEAYEESIKSDETLKDLKVESKTKKVQNEDLVEVENINNCLVKFAKCCSPIPGDEIVGYITFSNGVSIHRKDCHNLNNLDIKSRTIQVKWKTKTRANFITRVRIRANERDGILSDIVKTLKDLKVEITEINTKVTPDRENITNVAISIQDIDKLQSTIKTLRKIDSVFEVKRIR